MTGCDIPQLKAELVSMQAELAQVRKEDCADDPNPPECWKLRGGSIITLQKQIWDLQEQINQCVLVTGFWLSLIDFPDGRKVSQLFIGSWDSSNLMLDLTIRPFVGPKSGSLGPTNGLMVRSSIRLLESHDPMNSCETLRPSGKSMRLSQKPVTRTH